MSKHFSRRRSSVADSSSDGHITSSHLRSNIEGNASGGNEASNRDTEVVDMNTISACGSEHDEDIISLDSSPHPSLVLTPEGDTLFTLLLNCLFSFLFKN